MAVRVIKASQKQTQAVSPSPEPEKIPVCAYCRVSTDSEEQETSYDAQVKHYTEYINSHPEYKLVKIYADQGISGTSRKNRDQFNQMMKDCEAGLIKIILTKSISRWARNTVDSIQTIRHLKDMGIAVIFEKENINTLDAKGVILITIMSSIAQQESDSISKNVRLGIQYLMQQGKGRLNTSQFLGYDKDLKDRHKYVIIPSEAEVVRLIYREYLEGYSPGSIAAHLTTDHIKTPAGKDTWYQSTVTSILENEFYCGDLLMQKYYVTDFLTHKLARNTGQLPQYFVEDHHPPIIPKEVYYQVQGEVQRRSLLKYDPSKIRYGSSNALMGRLQCGICGRTLKEYKSPSGKSDWRCRKRAYEKQSITKEVQAKCPLKIVPGEKIQSVIVDALNRVPSYREDLIRKQAAIRDGEIKRIDAEIDANRERQKRLTEQLAALEADGNDSEFLENELEQAEVEETTLIFERAEAANKELKLRLLLELVETMRDHPPLLRKKDPSCSDYDEFFQRTRFIPESDVMKPDGEIVSFDNGMVVRYLEKVTVLNNGYEVKLKAGLEIFIED